MSKLKLFFIFVIIIILAFLIVKPSKTDGKTHIKFTSWGSESEIEILKPILANFEKENPDIKCLCIEKIQQTN